MSDGLLHPDELTENYVAGMGDCFDALTGLGFLVVKLLGPEGVAECVDWLVKRMDDRME